MPDSLFVFPPRGGTIIRMRLWAIFVAAVLSAACSRVPLPPDTVVIGVETGPATLDPRFAADAVSVNACSLIHAGLMRRDENMALRPYLAESVERKDPVTYVIRLRAAVRFHDDRELTSADVRYTLESILNGVPSSPLKGQLGDVASVENPDPLTVVVKLKTPFAPFAGNLTFGIVPTGSGDLSRNPVGAGPFRFVSYERGQRLELTRSPVFFGEKPKLAGVIFKVVPDETVRLLELENGNVHIVTSPITPAVLPWLEKQKNITALKRAGSNVSYIGFNLRDRYLKDARVRRAIAHAIDRNAIITHLLKGQALKTETLVASANPFHAAGLAERRYDPAESKRLLDEAGYSDPGNGVPRFTLVYKTSKNPTRQKIAEIFAQYLRAVGIGMEIKSFEWGTFFADIKSGNFQMYSLTWVGMVDPDILRFIFHSTSAPPDGANRGGYENHRVDELLDAGRGQADADRRKEIYGEVQAILSEELPYITLWTSVNVAAVNRRVKGFVVYPDESLDSLARVTLSPENGRGE